jgi:hypothetical protein
MKAFRRKMGSASLFSVFIDLPESEYFFTPRITFWQIFFSIMSVIFVAIDTAIEDIISRVANKIKQKMENLVMSFGGMLCPQVACA